MLTIKLHGIEPGRFLITKKPTGEGGAKSRPLVSVADDLAQIKKGVRMAEWLRPGLWEVLTIKLRGIEPGEFLIIKKPTGEGGAKSRPLVTVGGVSQIWGVRIAEWLRPGLWEVLTIKLRGIEPGQILITKKPTGESGAKVTSSCNCGRRKPNLGGQDGRVVKASRL